METTGGKFAKGHCYSFGGKSGYKQDFCLTENKSLLLCDNFGISNIITSGNKIPVISRKNIKISLDTHQGKTTEFPRLYTSVLSVYTSSTRIGISY